MKKHTSAFLLALSVLLLFVVTYAVKIARAQSGNTPKPAAAPTTPQTPPTQATVTKTRPLGPKALADRTRRAKEQTHRATGCTGGATNGIYNLLAYNRCMGETNDTGRINRAIDDAVVNDGSGIVFFPGGTYDINETIPLPSGITIQGSDTLDFALCIVHQTAELPIFEITEEEANIVVRDIALMADSHTGTIGIWAHGGSGTDDRGDSTYHCLFSNLQFTSLGQGIFVEATNDIHDWQFDNIRLEHGSFRDCYTGVELSSFDTSWLITNCVFNTGAGKKSVKIDYSGWVTMIGLEGNGGEIVDKEYVKAATFIEIGAHAAINLQNSISEGFDKSLDVTSASRNNPITLLSNNLQEKVDLSMTCAVTSMGNQYSDNSVVVGAGTQVYSFGDKFCFNGIGCGKGDFVDTSGAVKNVAFRTGEYQRAYSTDGGVHSTDEEYIGTSTNFPTKFFNYVRVDSNEGGTYESAKDTDGTGDLPLFTISSGDNNAKPLFRLGTSLYFYTLDRDGSDGYLNFLGNQTSYAGYRFKTSGSSSGTVTVNHGGSITIGSTTYSALGSPDNGTLMYCTDCQQVSSCTGSGSGALAKRINGSWVCN